MHHRAEKGPVGVANLQLDPGVLVKSFPEDEMPTAAFDMDWTSRWRRIRVLADHLPSKRRFEGQPLSQVAYRRSRFLGSSEAAGGKIRGKLTSGLAREAGAVVAPAASITIQWESARWDSLARALLERGRSRRSSQGKQSLAHANGPPARRGEARWAKRLTTSTRDRVQIRYRNWSFSARWLPCTLRKSA